MESFPSTGYNPLVSPNGQSATCAECSLPVTGQFVRALNVVFHKDCFRCKDCNTPVAHKFFPVDMPDGGRYPLCETDYFRRLGLICANCGLALRGSYITACSKKYHTDHFTCSICPTLFGPQDSYYEHGVNVYCHFHYSTRFANRCAGCDTAILKQFVEVNRNMREEAWHPECYMIHKFWNVKMSSVRRPTSNIADSASESSAHGADDVEPWVEEEKKETHGSIKQKQTRMEQQVLKIWTILSSFEESSAACISDMLRHVSDGDYLEAIRNAERFILHVEVLFAAIDDLEYTFASLNVKGMSHVREARVLCKKTVDLFTLLQKPHKNQGGMTQELLALVTGLAHYLKVLIRIALTAALKLDREYKKTEAVTEFLESLNSLLLQRGDASARRLKDPSQTDIQDADEGVAGTRGVMYGYRSLAPEFAGESPFWPTQRGRQPPPNVSLSDMCMTCDQPIDEDCVRLGTFQRWHSHCIKCRDCGRAAAPPPQPPRARTAEEKEAGIRPSTVRRPPAPVHEYVFELPATRGAPSPPLSTAFDSSEGIITKPSAIRCIDHRRESSRGGFQPVTRLEQYAFLLNVALRRLYILLKKPGIIPDMPLAALTSEADRQSRRESTDSITPLRSVHNLDRKLSATARIPKRSTIIEAPAEIVAQPTILRSQRSNGDLEPPLSQQFSGDTQGTMPKRQQSLHTPNPGTYQQPPLHLQPALPTGSQSMPASPAASSASGSRPPFNHTNTAVHVVEAPLPLPPSPGDRYSPQPGDQIDGQDIDPVISLADIPQLIEAEQAREQHRALPGQSGKRLIAELSQLELSIIKMAALWKLTRSPLREYIEIDPMLEYLDPKKGGFWKKFFNQGDKKVKKKGVFCVPLELLVEREGTESMLGVSTAPLRVPSFIDDIVSAMKQMDMSVEGIFRKNGNIRRINSVIESLDRDPGSVDLSQDNPVQLAALLKRFLRDLPDPLLTYKLHKLWIGTQSIPQEQERHQLLHMVMLLLPRSHRDTLEVVLVFLKWVASFSHIDEETGSKMDLQNLSTVISPSILKTNKKDGLRDEFLGIRAVTQLLEEQDEFYSVPEEFTQILQDQNSFATALDWPVKDFWKRVDNYMKITTQGARSPMPPSQQGYYGGRGPMYDLGSPQQTAPSPGSSSRQNSDYQPGASSDQQYRATGQTAPQPMPDYPINAHYSPQQQQYYNERYNGGQLAPHPGMPHQPYSTSGRQTPPASPRPSTEQYWSPPPPVGSGQRRGSSGNRPASFARPEPSGPMSLPQPRNSPLGA